MSRFSSRSRVVDRADPGPNRTTNPFPGPIAFTEERAKYFVGREVEAARLGSLVNTYAFTLLHAPSGAGKSSLINAKIIPSLRDGGNQIIGPARVMPVSIDLPEPSGGNPYVVGMSRSLADTFPIPFTSTNELRRTLLDEGSQLDEDGNYRPVTVVFDQFEEILQICDGYAEHQASFMKTIEGVARDRPHIRFLFVARDDQLGPVLRVGRCMSDGFTAQMHLEAILSENAERLLTVPAAAAGKEFTADVVQQIVHGASIENYVAFDYASHQSAVRSTKGKFVGLVTLQVAARALWKEAADSSVISKDHLEQIGNFTGALENYYDATVSEAVDAAPHGCLGFRRISRGSREKSIRTFFEKEFLTPGDQRVMVPVDEASRAVSPQAISAMTDRAVLRELREGPGYYELCHDSLIKPVRDSNQRFRRQWRRKLYRSLAGLIIIPYTLALLVAVIGPGDDPVSQLENILGEEVRTEDLNAGEQVGGSLAGTDELRVFRIPITSDQRLGVLLRPTTVGFTARLDLYDNQGWVNGLSWSPGVTVALTADGADFDGTVLAVVRSEDEAGQFTLNVDNLVTSESKVGSSQRIMVSKYGVTEVIIDAESDQLYGLRVVPSPELTVTTLFWIDNSFVSGESLAGGLTHHYALLDQDREGDGRLEIWSTKGQEGTVTVEPYSLPTKTLAVRQSSEGSITDEQPFQAFKVDINSGTWILDLELENEFDGGFLLRDLDSTEHSRLDRIDTPPPERDHEYAALDRVGEYRAAVFGYGGATGQFMLTLRPITNQFPPLEPQTDSGNLLSSVEGNTDDLLPHIYSVDGLEGREFTVTTEGMLDIDDLVVLGPDNQLVAPGTPIEAAPGSYYLIVDDDVALGQYRIDISVSEVKLPDVATLSGG